LVTSLDSKPYNWEAVVLGFTGGPEPHDGSNIWFRPGHRTVASPAEDTGHALGSEIDTLFRQGAQELDDAKRKAIYDRWQVSRVRAVAVYLYGRRRPPRSVT
jgi:peptide/nickel transport system substrate-binding protein